MDDGRWVGPRFVGSICRTWKSGDTSGTNNSKRCVVPYLAFQSIGPWRWTMAVTPVCGSGPPGLRGRISDHRLFEERDSLGEAFVDAHQRILMLDRESAVVTGQAQLADERTPKLWTVPVANRAEDPRA